MGGSLALHLAEAFPERVRAVVTGDTSLRLAIHTQVMNNRRSTKLFGLRRKLASRPMDELIRRGLDKEQAIELSQLDPHVMDFHAEGRVEEFFEGIGDIYLDEIRCPLMLTQANPEKGGLLQDEEITARLSKSEQQKIRHFDCGHDMEINLGAQSPFFNAAIQFFNTLESQ